MIQLCIALIIGSITLEVMVAEVISASGNTFGQQLKQWRIRRNFSQLSLSLSSNVSQRHISFIESGRSRPSREMVLKLAAVLDIPLRQQNQLLTAAGFAPIFSEQALAHVQRI